MRKKVHRRGSGKETAVAMLQLRTLIDGNYGTAIVATVGARLIGTVTLGHLNSASAFVTSLYVATDYRKRGIGRKLVNECIELAWAHKCESISLTVQPKNRSAAKFYRRIGFVLGHEYGDGQVLFVKPLRK